MNHSPTSPEKPSPVEKTKEGSHYLLGDIPSELRNGQQHFEKDAVQLLKHHGTYQQDDRDRRAAAKAAGDGKAYMFMVRTKIPGGRLTSGQLLTQIDLGDELGQQSLRITSRQGLQLHGIVKSNLAETIRRINEVQMTTWGGCGDVNRNVMCCPAPLAQPVRQQMQQLTDLLARYFAPRTSSYHQIWLQGMTDESLNEDKTLVVGDPIDPVEPIYGRHYLPRKFKMGIALPEDNCIDVYTHDVGLLAVADEQRLLGYNVLVGGGFGVTPSAKKTFPALAQPLCFATPENVLAVATAIVQLQRDFGNRSDRKRARLKYLVHDWGIDAIGAKVREYLRAELPPPRDLAVSGHDDHIGWHSQQDGKFFYGLNVENGRIRDDEQRRLKTALRVLCRELQPGIRLTAHQSMLFTDLPETARPRLEQILRDHGVLLSEQISPVRRWSMACVAWPTCGLSITEAERALPGMIDHLEVELAKMGLANEHFTLRMTGCPNGCARPYNPDIGLVGKAKGKYTIFLGGGVRGDRLSFLYQDLVSEEDVVRELSAVFAYFRQDRQHGESLGDFCARRGGEAILEFRNGYFAD